MSEDRMSHARLYPNIPNTDEYRAINYMLNRAQVKANLYGGAPDAFDFTPSELEKKVRQLGEQSVMWDRDATHREAVLDLLIPMLADAITLDYDIGRLDVFGALFAVAIEMHSKNYSPMRVLGHTAEAMIKPRNNK